MKNKCLIIITGDLAAGKTTYGLKIAESLGISFFSKDKIKEIIFDSMSDKNLSYEEKKKIGANSYDILYSIAEEMMRKKKTFILESNFVKESIPILKDLIKKYNYKSITIRFQADLKKLHQRFLMREKSSERHKGLVSDGVFDDFEVFKKTSDNLKEFKLDNQEILVDTTDFSKVNLLFLIQNIKNCIQKA